MKYCFSLNFERFFDSYETKDLAIYNAILEIVREDCARDVLEVSFIIAECVPPAIVTDVGDMVIEHIADNAAGEYGECTEDWLTERGLSEKLDALIQPIINKFIHDNDPPRFYGIEKDETVKVKDFMEIYSAVIEDEKSRKK